MRNLIEKWLIRAWNRRFARRGAPHDARALDLGARVTEDETGGRVTIPQGKRPEHIACLGRTGTGKSSLLRYVASQDLRAHSRGFLYFDLHGDATDFIVSSVADEEKALGEDLSDRLIVIKPGDSDFSVGMNPLERRGGTGQFVQIAEFAQVLRERWHLDTLGARTDELLRNALYVLADAGLTLLEIGPLLTHTAFRTGCLKKVTNAEVRQYFELRYDPLSDAMRTVMAEPILNKTTAFTADPHFRHIVGQQYSTFSLLESIDAGRWIVLNLDKGRLGEQSPTLGALFFTAIKNALFARRKRELFTIYADEVQNLIAYGGGLETVLSEARKFGVSIVSANQYLEQYPPDMRAAISAVGSHLYFQLSSGDAQQIANALDGGKSLAERLKNLPKRHLVAKIGNEPWQEAVVPTVKNPKSDPTDLYARSCARWAKRRADIEAEIAERQSMINRTPNEAINDWE
ncbi:MAG TPA: type IV secretion system DNA-binding domain-containing protein [Bryobacteraceae bacterium]|nr:type IV secretion system DNA-binding domain-containing protein [Bryobacteraceae bacterium]